MNESLISVQLPTYNQCAYLSECIESIRAQTWPHWELIVVDDGSTDDTWSVLQRYAHQDARIKPWRFASNRGVCSAVARATELCQGELLHPRATDNPLVSETFFARAIDAFARYPGIAAVFALTRAIDEQGNVLGHWGAPRTKTEYVSPEQGIEEFFLSKYLSGESVILKRKLLIEHGGYDEALGPLLDLYINEALVALYGGVYLDDVVSATRLDMASFSRRQSTRQMLRQAALAEVKFRALPLAMTPKPEWIASYRDLHLADSLLWPQHRQLADALARITAQVRGWPRARVLPAAEQLCTALAAASEVLNTQCEQALTEARQLYESIAGEIPT
ncbi:glycosyltransferase family 2 protein [Burkholderia diffusa]|uniref:glycosyltransferase family 2 protein n=1 Tax=Burkholderia diffusa TaxID=488732 RepID=UPI000759FCB5|nr:glycosyltransferase [Burkholderia diffusa]KVN06949.1 hypothetical protein WJ62_05715 [Burkholderia diffusa]